MKNLFIILSIFFVNNSFLFSQEKSLIVPKKNQIEKIQIAFLVDASKSMEIYLDQVKLSIWSTIKQLNSLQNKESKPVIEIAIYEYGSEKISPEVDFVRQLSYLSKDMDFVSEKLFTIVPFGGSEYCSSAISKSLNELNWSISSNDLRFIFLLGNEAFNQSRIDYKTICEIASDRKITINTVFCGEYKIGIQELWEDASKIGHGNYYSIDPKKINASAKTSYDEKLIIYNDSLDKSYYGTRRLENERKSVLNQIKITKTPPKSSKNTKTIVKIKDETTEQIEIDDLIDNEKEGDNISKIEESKLPLEFKGKSDSEKKKLIEKKRQQRALYKTKIFELEKARQKIMGEGIKKRVESGETDSLCTSIIVNIQKRITEIEGIEK